MDSLVLKFFVMFFIGALSMLVISFSFYRKSYFYKKSQAKDKAGKPGLSSYLVTLTILLMFVASLFLFDLWISTDRVFSFFQYAGLNLLLAALLSAFDALFIDYFILLVWRPSFLKSPEGFPTRAKMLRHIKLQFSLGWIFKIGIAVLAAGLAAACL